MKKILIWIITLILAINILGCKQNPKDFNFNYQLKEDYSGKINEELLQSFITFTKDTSKLYETGFDDFKKYDSEKGVDNFQLAKYMGGTLDSYKILDIWNVYEEEILDIMQEQRLYVLDLSMLELTHTIHQHEIEEKIDPEYSPEYFDEELEDLKISMKENLEKAKKYID